MPHISVKLWPGKDESKKQQLAEAIKELTVRILEVPETSISVAIEDVAKEDWLLKVKKPDIIDNDNNVYIYPGFITKEPK